MIGERTCLVTGGAGFIGSHMVDLLLDHGCRVRVIDNLATGREENLKHHQSHPRLTFEVRDLRDVSPDDRLFSDVEFVFHLAGVGDIVPSIERPIDYLSANVMGTVRALEASRQVGVRKFVYAASSSCYGRAREMPTTELAEIRPQYPYALSKYLGELASLHWGQVYRLPVISMRIFNAYGPRCGMTGVYGAVFGVFLAQKLAGKPFTVVGDGAQSRDFVFVSDVVRAFWLAAESERVNEIYNVGAGKPQSVNRLVELLGGEVVHVPRRPGEPDCTWADISKIGEHLGWQPRVSFEEGVSTMLSHIENWRGAPVWDRESVHAATGAWLSALSAVEE